MADILYQFDFSKEQLKKRTWQIFSVLFPMLVIYTLVVALFLTDFKIKTALSLVWPVVLFAAIILTIEIPLINKIVQKSKVLIYGDRIVKKCGKREKSISWASITKFKIEENSRGEIIHLKLWAKDGTVLWLGGLNEMEKLTSTIKERIPDHALVVTKRWRLDVRAMVVLAMMCMTIVMVIIGSFGRMARDMFAVIFLLGTSGLFFLWRPLGRSDARFKWPEIAWALLMFLFGIWGLIMLLRLGYLP